MRAPHNPHNHVQFIARALQAQVRNGQVETIAQLTSTACDSATSSWALALRRRGSAARHARQLIVAFQTLLSPPAKGDNKPLIFCYRCPQKSNLSAHSGTPVLVPDTWSLSPPDEDQNTCVSEPSL